jgi:hypothetical protein
VANGRRSETTGKTRKEVVNMRKEKGKCMFKGCNHADHEHNEGLCWFITQPDAKGLARYCPCTRDGQTHRLFDTIGKIYPDKDDAMVTKFCDGCDYPAMLKVEETICTTCKNLAIYKK